MTVLQSPYMISSCSPLFVFVGPAKRCSLENFDSPWCATTVDFQTLEKKQMKI
jgi:hypothetical protein